MYRQFLTLIFTIFGTYLGHTQVAKTSELFLQLKKQDSVFFERSFNLCDLDYLSTATHQDLIFFHDQGGIQNRQAFLESVRNNICGNPNQKPIRKLTENSLEVFPLYKDGTLYGAIQNGVHDFYIREPNKADRHTNRARFTHVWLLENGTWLLKEVLSYDHQEPNASTAAIPVEKEIESWLKAENVPALGMGIIENGQLQKINVFGTLDKKNPAPYNAIFKVASLTKPVTAIVALKLVSEGKLGLDEPLDAYWKDPDLGNNPWMHKLTARIILSHQTGFPNWRYLNESKKLSFAFEPGTRFQYSGEGFEYLRKAMEAKFGRSLEQLADSLVFTPANMKDTRFWWDAAMDTTRYVQNFDKYGNAHETVRHYKANASANLLTTVEDYGNFLVYVLQGAGLSQAVQDEMHKNQVKLKEQDYFGLGWEKITGFSNDEYILLHSGKDPGVSTLAVIFPKSKNGWLIFLNGDNDMKLIEKMLTEKLYLGAELWNKK